MSVLKEEVQKPEYNGMTVKEIRDSLNSKTITVSRSRRLDAKGLLRELGISDGSAVLEALEAQSTNTAVKWALEDLKREGIDVNDPQTQAQLDALLSAELATKVKSLAEVQISRAEQLGLGKVKGRQIEVALNG